MPPTDTALRNVKPGAKPFKLYHERGLFVIVTPLSGVSGGALNIASTESTRHFRLACIPM